MSFEVNQLVRSLVDTEWVYEDAINLQKDKIYRIVEKEDSGRICVVSLDGSISPRRGGRHDRYKYFYPQNRVETLSG